MTRDTPPTRAERFGQYVAEAARAVGYDIDSPRGGGKKALAEDAGMSHASVSRMLSGQTIPDPKFFEPLADSVGIELFDLLVRSGLVSDEIKIPGSDRPPKPRRLTPTQAAHALGINDPRNIAVFEALVNSLLEQEGKGKIPQRGAV